MIHKLLWWVLLFPVFYLLPVVWAGYPYQFPPSKLWTLVFLQGQMDEGLILLKLLPAGKDHSLTYFRVWRLFTSQQVKGAQ